MADRVIDNPIVNRPYVAPTRHFDDVDEIALWMIDTEYDEESFFVRHCYFTGGGVDPCKRLKTALRAGDRKDERRASSIAVVGALVPLGTSGSADPHVAWTSDMVITLLEALESRVRHRALALRER